MPANRKQQRMAGRELRIRRQGQVYRDPANRPKSRPFGHSTDEALRAMASNPDPRLQKQAAQQEQARRRTGGERSDNPRHGMRSASDKRVNTFAAATEAAIERANRTRR